jgi:hypothetical protein
MRKRRFAIYSVLVVAIVLLAVLVPSCGQTYPTYPSDLQIEAFAGGFAPWTPLYMIQIYPDGSAVYSQVAPENRGTATWTHISSFNLTVDQMNVIWDAIATNNFFSLEQNYSTPVVDGTFAGMNITANGVTHTVLTQNTKVVAFDSVVTTINDGTPGDLDLFYNAIYPEADPPSTTMVLPLNAGCATAKICPLSPPEVNSPDANKVTIKGCNITVTICIELCGPGANDTVAANVKKDIEYVWNRGDLSNGDKPHVQCAYYCDNQDPGCPVRFDADVIIGNGTASKGFHQVSVVDKVANPNHRADMYKWGDNETQGVYAHEAGHLMGEIDQYTDYEGFDEICYNSNDWTIPFEGHKEDIMGSLSGKPTQDSIDRIVAWGVVCPCDCCPAPFAPPRPPTPKSPPMGNTVPTLTTRLEWNASTGATSYGLQVATDSTFMHLVGSGNTTNLYYDVPSGWLNSNTGYYWRVNATSASGTSDWSDYWHFKTAPPPPPPPPTLSSPAMGSNVSTLTPRLEWNASAGATSYIDQVATDSTFMHLVASGITPNLYSDVPSGWLNWNTGYYWRVNATNTSGTSAWSAHSHFKTAAGP